MRFVLASLVAVFAMLVLVPGCKASCKPMEVYGTNMACGGGSQGYAWTGTSCIYTSVCNCTGADCQRLYATQSSCETAHLGCK